MPLDPSLCTFTLTQVEEGSSTAIVAEQYMKHPSYKKRKLNHPTAYAITLDDPYCESKLYGEIQGPKDLRSIREVTLVLHDPHEVVSLQSSSPVRFSWKFRYGGQKFRFRKESTLSPGPSSLSVEWVPSKEFKDDPCITVAQIAIKAKRVELTMIDYNLARLCLEDLKGFEVCVILSLFFFFDMWEAEGHRHNLPLEAIRLEQFRCPAQELEDVRRSESQAAKLRQDQASSEGQHSRGGKFGRLLRRKSVHDSTLIATRG